MPGLSAWLPHVARGAAALAAGVLVLGCGRGSGAEAGGVQLTVTEGDGSRPVAQVTRIVDGGGTTLLELLRGATRIRTEPGGRIAAVGGRPGPWSIYVNGIAHAGAAAKARVHPGDRVWLDRHAPGAARRPGAVVGAFPEPFVHGRAGKRLPVRVECGEPGSEACRRVARTLIATGVVAAQGGVQSSFTEHTLRVLVGPWSTLRRDENAKLLQKGPLVSGVYAQFDTRGGALALLDAGGAVRRTLRSGGGLIAATRLADEQPVWLVTGTDRRGVAQAAAAFAEAALARRFALAVSGDVRYPLPYPPGRRGSGRSGA